jgi:CBS domain containing-hemolysin-like protein
MFDYFQEHNTRAAIILGEYGEVLGIVTMKDVLTFIFGEISGRMEGQEYYQEEDENSYTVPGEMRLADFYNLTNFDIEDPVMATIGGVAFRLFDRMPAEGDKVLYEGYEFTAKEITGLRISKVRVCKLSEGKPQPEITDEDEVQGEEQLTDSSNTEKEEGRDGMDT